MMAMNAASFGQSFSPYTTNHPLQPHAFSIPGGQVAPSHAQNVLQQQQQHMAGGKCCESRCGCAGWLM